MHCLHLLLSLSFCLALPTLVAAQQVESPQQSSRLKQFSESLQISPERTAVRPGGRIAQPDSARRAVRQRTSAAQNEPTEPGRGNDAKPASIGATLKALNAKGPYDLSSSGRYLVATQGDRGLLLFDVPARRLLRQLEQGERGYTLVEISGDARWVAGVRAADPDLIDLWRADNGRLVRTIQAEGGEKKSLEFSADGTELKVLADGGRGVTYSIPGGVSIGGFQSARGGSAIAPPTVTIGPKSIPKMGERQQSSAAPRRSNIARDAVEPQSSASREPSPTAHPYIPKVATSSPATTGPRMAEPQEASPELAQPRMAEPPTADPMAISPETAEPMTASPYESPSPEAEPMASPSDVETEPQATPTLAPRAMLRAEPPAQPAGAAPPIEEPTPAGSDAPAKTSSPEFAAPTSPAASAPAAAPSAPGANSPAQTVAQHPPAAPEDLSKVTVHYATNRNRLGVADRTWLVYFQGFFFSLPAVIVYAVTVLAILVFPWFGKRSWAAASLLTGVLVLVSMASLEAYVRSQLRDELSGELYGAVPTGLSYGTCEISVPKPENRTAGELNRPLSVWVLEAPENADKHFVLRKVTEHADKDAFYESLSAQLALTEDGASLLFIHGYNVSFEDAIFRTAQLAVDLKYRGAPISFSWPSYADPVKYTFDEQNAEVSIPALREFLEDLVARSGAKRIHIVAHSMGNRVLAGALRSMTPESRLKNKEMFREIVLAAPDIDSRVFQTQVLPHLEENTQHCTLYASSRDRALMMSRYFHNYQRLGETEPQLIVANGMDTIDASLVDTSLLGHSYIGDVQSIVSDLHDLVVVGKRPKERGGLEAELLGELMYWAIKPQWQTAADPDTRR